MIRLVSVTMCVGFVLAVAPRLRAQDCHLWTNWDLRGTYTVAGIGWIDLSKEVDKSLPAGYSPTAFVQAFTYDGKGGGTGWISANLGGVQFSAPVKWTYAMQADCSVRATHSFEISGVWTAPASVLWVVGGQPNDLELKGIELGTGPGSQVPQAIARRISTQ
jgi:hypothetical protein